MKQRNISVFFNNTKCCFALFVFTVIFVAIPAHLESQIQKKPNIILAHDLGQHLNCCGVDRIRTPNIDHLTKK